MGLFDSDEDDMPGNIRKTAEISECQSYRYLLTRTWDESLPICGWIMLNPSTADAQVDDPTIHRCIGFARSWGCGSIEVVNLFAYRSTQPVALMEVSDPIGPDNDRYIRDVASRCRPMIAAWGAMGFATARASKVRAMLADLRDPANLECLGLTKDGRPRHPLYVKADVQRVDFAMLAAGVA